MSHKKEEVCPICESGSLRPKSIREVFEYKGHKCPIDDYVVLECSLCGEEIVSKDSLKRAQKIIVDFQRKVDGLLTSNEIRQIRLSLGLTQKEMWAMLGGGEKSFARYENATLKQSRGMDNLLRFLKRYPLLVRNAHMESQQTTGGVAIVEMVAYNSSGGNDQYDMFESGDYYDAVEYRKASGF